MFIGVLGCARQPPQFKCALMLAKVLILRIVTLVCETHTHTHTHTPNSDHPLGATIEALTHKTETQGGPTNILSDVTCHMI